MGYIVSSLGWGFLCDLRAIFGFNMWGTFVEHCSSGADGDLILIQPSRPLLDCFFEFLDLI